MTPLSFAELAAAGYLVVVALMVGSFINLAADRVPRGESIVRPRSHCRSCGRDLDLTDLVPVASYLVRRGRCATCGVAIGVSSPLVEAACGAGMAGALISLGLGRGAIVGTAAVVFVGIGVLCLSYAQRRRLDADLARQDRVDPGVAVADHTGA